MEMNVELQTACSALGFFEGDKYHKEPDCLETVKDLIRFLKREDEDTCDIRRQLGEAQILQKDLLYILKLHPDDTVLFETVIRLMVNLTQPAFLCWQHIPEDKERRQCFIEVEGYLQNYKQAFADESLFAALTKKLGDLLQLDWERRQEEDRMLIERLLILLRNILHVPPNLDREQRTDDDASVHDQVLWAIHVSGMEDLLLYLASSENERQFAFHVLEIVSLMFREQNPEQLAKAGAFRTHAERKAEEDELAKIREMEKMSKKAAILKQSARHSRFGGTYVMANMKSISDRNVIFHRKIEKANSMSFDQDKKQKKIGKNRKPVTDAPLVRRSTLSIRLFLKEFCVQFLENCYNPLMHAVKDTLLRAKAQDNDETYYLWAMRFFMEFQRRHQFRIDTVGETLSVPTFHYIQTNMITYFEMITQDKKQALSWSRRTHLGLKAYRELLETLNVMGNSQDPGLRDSSRVIRANVFYMIEYRELFLTLLKNFKESKQSRQYLQDLIETTHLFLRMLEQHCKGNKHVMVQKKKKKKGGRKKTKRANQENQPPQHTQEELEELWDTVSGELSTIFQGRETVPEGVTPFDAASQVEVDEQRIEAMIRIQDAMRQHRAGEAVAILRAAREVWPEREEFGRADIEPEQEFMALREVFFADLPHFTGNGGGKETVLTRFEEEQLVGYVKFMAVSGCPVNKAMLRLFATDVARKANRTTPWDEGKEATDGWARGFLKRHPELKTGKLVSVEDSRAKVTRQQVITSIEARKKVIDDKGLKAHQIFNMDEAGWSQKEGPTQQKGIILSSMKTGLIQHKAQRDHITVTVMIGADGTVCPPMITSTRPLHQDCEQQGPANALYRSTKNGFQTKVLTLEFLNHCLKFITKDRPVMLDMDSASVHLGTDIVDWAKKNNIILFYPVPHSSHILQALDKVFGPLKQAMMRASRALGYMRSDLVITANKFPAMLAQGLRQVTQDQITGAFKTTGTYPAETDHVDMSQVMRQTMDEIDLPRIVPLPEPPMSEVDESGDHGGGAAGVAVTVSTQTDMDGACPTCGYIWASNILVEKGIITRKFAESILVPQKAASTRKSRACTTCKVVQGGSVYNGDGEVITLSSSTIPASSEEPSTSAAVPSSSEPPVIPTTSESAIVPDDPDQPEITFRRRPRRTRNKKSQVNNGDGEIITLSSSTTPASSEESSTSATVPSSSEPAVIPNPDLPTITFRRRPRKRKSQNDDEEIPLPVPKPGLPVMPPSRPGCKRKSQQKRKTRPSSSPGPAIVSTSSAAAPSNIMPAAIPSKKRKPQEPSQLYAGRTRGKKIDFAAMLCEKVWYESDEEDRGVRCRDCGKYVDDSGLYVVCAECDVSVHHDCMDDFVERTDAELSVVCEDSSFLCAECRVPFCSCGCCGKKGPEAEVIQEEEEEEDEVEQEEIEATFDTSEQEFDLREYIMKFCQPQVVKAYVLLLAEYRKNSLQVNHAIVKMLHRIGFEYKMIGMLFQARLFRTFQKVLADPAAKSKHFQELATFAKYVVRNFFEVAEKNPKVFVELFFWKGVRDAVEVVDGYGTYQTQTKAGKVAWTEAQDDELRQLFEQFQNDENKPEEGDVADYIMLHLLDQTKSRRQIVREMVHLELIGSAKDLKKGGRGKSRRWREEEEMELRALYEEFKESQDPVGNILEKMSNPRSKVMTINKLLDMGLVKDRSELYKKRGKSGRKKQGTDDEDGSGSDGERVKVPKKKKGSKNPWVVLEGEEELPTWSSSEDEAGGNKEPSGPTESNNRAPSGESDVESPPGGSSDDDDDDDQDSPAFVVHIRKVATSAREKGFEPGMQWLSNCLSQVADDREEDEDEEPIPLVPLTDEQETAMEDKTFQNLLKKCGVKQPDNEQERFWRVPGHLTPADLRARVDALKPQEKKTAKTNDRLEALLAKVKGGAKRKRRTNSSNDDVPRASGQSKASPQGSPVLDKKKKIKTKRVTKVDDSSDDNSDDDKLLIDVQSPSAAVSDDSDLESQEHSKGSKVTGQDTPSGGKKKQMKKVRVAVSSDSESESEGQKRPTKRVKVAVGTDEEDSEKEKDEEEKPYGEPGSFPATMFTQDLDSDSDIEDHIPLIPAKRPIIESDSEED